MALDAWKREGPPGPPVREVLIPSGPLLTAADNARDDDHDWLTATRLRAPEPPAPWVPRPRLVAALERATRRALTLVVAPAGSGKTVLLSSWLPAAAPGSSAWLTVDEHDDADGRLWLHVLAALSAVPAIPPESPLRSLRPAPAGVDPGFLRALVNALADLPAPIVVVVDDVQRLTEPEVLAQLEFVVTHAPASVRWVLLARHDPPFALQRLRAAGQVTELRAEDLAFDDPEADALLRAHGVALAPEDRSRLLARTEGWAVALRLAAFSLVRADDPGRFVAEFAGDDRAIAAYLTEEVIGDLPRDLRRFLLRTSLLERISAELANAMTGDDDGRRRLLELDRSGIFLIAVDARRQWFRYHPLLAEMLRAELALQAPREVPGLHARAAAWLADHGMLPEALHHAVAAADLELLSSVLARDWLQLFLDGQGAAAARAVDALPREVVAGNPELGIPRAAALLARGAWAAAEEQLAEAADGTDRVAPEHRARFDQGLHIVRLHAARLRGRMADILDEGRTLLALSDIDGDPSLAAVALVNIGVGELWTRGPAEAEEPLERGLSAARRAGREMLMLTALGALAAVALSGGRVGAAVRLAEEATELAVRRGWQDLPLLAMAYGTRASACHLVGDAEGAGIWRERARSVLSAGTDPLALAALGVLDHRAAMTRGDATAAAAAIRSARRDLARWPEQSWVSPLLVACEVEALVALDELPAARERLDGCADLATSGAILLAEARLHLAEGDPDRALKAVRAAQPPAAFGARFHAIDVAMLEARIHERRADIAAALQALERALSLVEVERTIRLVLDHGPAARRLLERAQRSTAHRALVDDLLDHLDGRAAVRRELVTEPLTKRELSVLRYLPTFRSVQEIAGELHVSPNTIRTHRRSIYRKLGVGQRRDAVKRARELGLIGGNVL